MRGTEGDRRARGFLVRNEGARNQGLKRNEKKGGGRGRRSRIGCRHNYPALGGGSLPGAVPASTEVTSLKKGKKNKAKMGGERRASALK